MAQQNIADFLKTIKDPKQRAQIQSILQSDVVKVVKCMSKKCKGRIVAHVMSDGTIKPITDDKGFMHLRAIRPRLDGFYGFQCWCGNDSRLCEAEKGVKGIEHNAPQKKDLEEVWNRLQKEPASYPEVNGVQDIDNFRIEKI